MQIPNFYPFDNNTNWKHKKVIPSLEKVLKSIIFNMNSIAP